MVYENHTGLLTLRQCTEKTPEVHRLVVNRKKTDGLKFPKAALQLDQDLTPRSSEHNSSSSTAQDKHRMVFEFMTFMNYHVLGL